MVEEILQSNAPVNVYARNADHKTPRHCTKGNLVLGKIIRKAEKRYLNEVFDPIEKVNECQLLGSQMNAKKLHYLTY